MLAKFFGHTRFIYNHMLNRKMEAYKLDKTRLSCYELIKELTLMKKQPEYSWLREVTNESLQQSIRNMDYAYQRFFKQKAKFPKFKLKYGKQTCKFIQNVYINFDTKKIKLPKIGWVRFHLDKTFDGKIGTVTVSKNTAGKYFVSICYKTDEVIPTKVPITSETTIGIDVGIKHFAVFSTGEKIDNPKFLEKMEPRLKILQRRLSKKKKGSNRRKRAQQRVANYHYKIACRRNDFLHKLSTKIIRENQSVVIEDLNISGMMKNHNLAKFITSVSWGEFTRQLKYKAEYSGKNVLTIGRFEPSTKPCSVCNLINNDLTLSDRHWTCLNCGTYHDRDINAAINIRNIGLKNSGEVIPVEDVEMLPIGESMKRQDKRNNVPISVH